MKKYSVFPERSQLTKDLLTPKPDDVKRGSVRARIKGFVYFIRDELGNIKIGSSTDVGNRLGNLQTATAPRA